jgi:hypothetical protein
LIADLLRQMSATDPAATAARADAVDEPVALDDESSARDPIPDRAQLEELLRRHGGIISDVARAVRRSRKQVYRWLELYQLDVAAFRSDGEDDPG